jgi:hypothetical protein
MAFIQGSSGNPNGREKGSVNKATAALKARIESILQQLDATILKDLATLRPEQRVDVWLKLQEYIRPKLSRTAVVGDADNPVRGVVQVEVIGTARRPTAREQDVML